MTDAEFLQAILSGDTLAWNKFHNDCRPLFFAWFKKEYPDVKSDVISEVYSKSILELWKQIINGKVSQGTLNCKLSSYLIGIGRNKLLEEIRIIKKNQSTIVTLGNGLLKIRRKRSGSDPPTGVDGNQIISLQSAKLKRELENFAREDLFRYRLSSEKPTVPFYEESTDWDLKLMRRSMVRQALKCLPEPCQRVLRDTWFKKLSDAEIMRTSEDGYPSADAVKTKRYKCHQRLKNILKSNPDFSI